MIDTVGVTLKLNERLDIGRFQAGEIYEPQGEAKPRRDKFWLNGRSDRGGPRVTYYRYAREEDAGLLRVEFSVPRMSFGAAMENHNPGPSNWELAFNLVDLYLNSKVSEALPSVRDWLVQRIDYGWNWRSERVSEYVDALSRLSYRGVHRQGYRTGVMWPSKTRTLKFYQRSDDVFRFEVSNFRDGARALAAWTERERTLRMLADPAVALLSLGYAFDGLGIAPDVPLSGGDDLLVARLRDAFGERGVASARHVLWCISQHGTRAYHKRLVGKSTYYVWRRKLLDAGFSLTDGGGVLPLPAPVLPLDRVLGGEWLSSPPQNLDDSFPVAATSPSKNSWPMLVQKLEIAENSPRCRYLEKAFSYQVVSDLVN